MYFVMVDQFPPVIERFRAFFTFKSSLISVPLHMLFIPSNLDYFSAYGTYNLKMIGY